MEIINTALTSAFSIVVLFLLTRVMGYREVSQFSMFDYITGISIGSIAAEMATGLENFRRPLVAMILYSLSAVLVSYATNKSVRLRKNLMGQPIILMNDGVIFYDRMKKAKLDISELMMELRARDYFDICVIKTIIMEINGKFSIIPYENKSRSLSVCLVMDGELIEENFKSLDIDKTIITDEMKKEGLEKIEDIFLAVYSGEKVRLFKRVNSKENFIF